MAAGDPPENRMAEDATPSPAGLKRKVRWIWAIVIGLAAGGVILYLALPTCVIPSSYSNETSARGALKDLLRAEAVWRQNDMDGDGKQDYWAIDLAGLCRVTGGPELIPAGLAAADRFPELAGGGTPATPGKPVAFHGYLYEALVSDENGKPYAAEAGKDGKPRMNEKKFGFRATPEKYGETGVSTYQVNEEGVIYVKDLGHGAEANPPRASWEGGADPTKDGWRVMD